MLNVEYRELQLLDLEEGLERMTTTATRGVACGLRLNPHGYLIFEREVDGEGSQHIPAALAEELEGAFKQGPGVGLLRLSALEPGKDVGLVLGYWQELAHRFLTRLCKVLEPELALARGEGLELSAEEAEALLQAAPPFDGREYLDVTALQGFWSELRVAFRDAALASELGVEGYLRGLSPLWSAVGRVFFHLAENKTRPDLPFAFLATYTSRVSGKGRLQHVPLGRAVQESALASDRAQLASLLAPLERVAASSELVRGLVESREIFRTIAWTPAQAGAFLREVPVYEEQGISVRVPDWWNPRKPPRLEVQMRIGQNEAAGMGADSLLDFSLDLALDGEPITREEWASVRATADGLALVRGRWVQVEPRKLEEVLKNWRKVERNAHASGLTFHEAMRLVVGLPSGGFGAGSGSIFAADSRELVSVRCGAWLEQVLEELRSGARSSVELPEGALRATLRPYQEAGVRWLELLHRLRLGGCLADDMGLGKTLQVIAFLLGLKHAPRRAGKHLPSLLVLPASLLGNWARECTRFAPGLTFRVAHASEGDRALLEPPASWECVDLVMTTYGMAARLPWLLETQWRVVVLDEAQAIKNHGTTQARAVKMLASQHRIALTGTPIENRLGDLWSLFDFLQPGYLGDAREFASWSRAAGSTPELFGKLRNLVRPYLLRRLKSDRNIIKDLPEKQEVKVYCGLRKTQAALYQQAVEDLSRQLKGGLSGMKRRGTVLAFLMRFKQICNHPAHWTGNGGYDPEESGKLSRLLELCEEIASRQEKVLVFTQFRELTAPLESLLRRVFRRPGLILDGSTSVARRPALVASFQEEGGPSHFVLSLKAGGTGLNLTAASHVVHFDRWWNPAVENQATDRAYRIGQTKGVLVHKLVCRGTIEERIDQMIESKSSLAEEVLRDGAEKQLTEMSNEELMALVAFDRNRALGDG